jgi:hypothetical protein
VTPLGAHIAESTDRPERQSVARRQEPARVRYRVFVEWVDWRVRVDGMERIEEVGQVSTAGELMTLLHEWTGAPGVARVWWMARGLGEVWRECGRAA